MTKTDIVGRVHTNTDCSKKEAFDMVEAVFGIIKDTLESGEKLKIAGNFVVKRKADRRGRNPQTAKESPSLQGGFLPSKSALLKTVSVNQRSEKRQMIDSASR